MMGLAHTGIGKMTDEETYAKGYIKGYEDGMRQTYDEVVSLATKRSYSVAELMLLVRSERGNVPDKVRAKKKAILKSTGIDLIEEDVAQCAESMVGVSPSMTVVIRERGATKGYLAFKQVMDCGAPGLCVSRSPPEQTSRKVPQDCNIFWLTKLDNLPEADKERCFAPNDTSPLYTGIKKFLMANNGKGAVVLLDGFSYLVTNSDFLTVLKWLQKLKDDVYMFRAILIIPVDPASLQSNEMRQLESELQVME
jgi:hypothetical protein